MVRPLIVISTLASVFAVTALGCATRSPVAQRSSGEVKTFSKAEAPRGPKAVVRDGALATSNDPAERILFMRSNAVVMMRPDGSDARVVLDAGHRHAAPAASPDGKQIALSRQQGGMPRLSIVDTDGSEQLSRKAAAGVGELAPHWSSDGRSVVFVRVIDTTRRDLVILNIADGDERVLLTGNDQHVERVGAPAWSPDGKTIVMSADRNERGGTVLWAINVDTGRRRRLTSPGGDYVHDRDPAWHPDGNRIVFASNRDATPANRDRVDLYTINPDGSGLTRLTQNGRSRDPAYSPDGKRLFFVSKGHRQNLREMELYVMAAQGGVQRRMTRDVSPQNSAPSGFRISAN